MAIAATKDTVFNRALVFLTQDRITSSTDEKHTARLLSAIYDETVDYMLEQHPWSFAKDTTELADAGATSDADGWTYKYALPVDFLNLVTINNTDPEDRLDQYYEIMGQELFCEESQVFLKYIRREDIVGRWTAKFMNAVAYALARDASATLAEGAARFEELNVKAEQALAEAKASDGKRQNRAPMSRRNTPTARARRQPWT